MSGAQKVVWTKGMFLLPQHFQAQDEYFEQLLHQRASASSFANWGFSRLDVDDASLLNGLFTLRFCSGIFPDGSTFQAPEVENLPAGRHIDSFFKPTAKTMDIFLAVAEHRPGARNFSFPSANGAEGASSLVRYKVENQAVVDATGGADEKKIDVARKSLRLFFEGENFEGFTALRVAQIMRGASGAFVVNPEFIPPLLDIIASENLMLLARRQVEIMAAKSASLSAPRRQKGQDLADFTTAEIASFWLLHTVNSALPELRHLWEVRRGHPDVLYRAMLRLAGALTTFALNTQMKDFPSYDHNALGPSFHGLDKVIRDLLETVLPSKCLSTPLHFVERLVWSASLHDDRQIEAPQVILAVSASVPMDELISKFPRLAKVAGPGELQRLIRNALPGVTLHHMPTPPPSVPLQLKNQYFRLQHGDPLWQGVAQARSLHVFVPAEIIDPRMELLTILS